MKIVYVSNAAIPSLTANSMHVMKMCQAMAQKGHQITLFAPQGRIDWSVKANLWNHYGIETKFPIKRIRTVCRFNNYIFAISAIIGCRYRLDIDLIYSRHLPSAFLASMTSLPVIFETHIIPVGRLAPALFRLMLKRRGLKRIVVISGALKRLLLTAFPNTLSSNKILVAPDAVDLERFENLPEKRDARNQLGLTNHNKMIAGYVGHLYSGRGIDLILQLAKCCPHITFLIVGGKPEDVILYRKKANNSQIKNAIFAGFVANRLIPLYYAASDVLLMPYQRSVSVSGGGDTSQWMSPMKMFEYMASGRLILASDLPALREVLTKRNSVLVDPEDIVGWRRALSKAELDSEWSHKISYQAKQDSKQYTWRHRVAKCLMC